MKIKKQLILACLILQAHMHATVTDQASWNEIFSTFGNNLPAKNSLSSTNAVRQMSSLKSNAKAALFQRYITVGQSLNNTELKELEEALATYRNSSTSPNNSSENSQHSSTGINNTVQNTQHIAQAATSFPTNDDFDDVDDQDAQADTNPITTAVATSTSTTQDKAEKAVLTVYNQTSQVISVFIKTKTEKKQKRKRAKTTETTVTIQPHANITVSRNFGVANFKITYSDNQGKTITSENLAKEIHTLKAVQKIKSAYISMTKKGTVKISATA